MAATEEERTAAASHVSAAIDTARHFPENVFRGDWHAFFFFDSDAILSVPEAIYPIHALLEAEGGSCAILQQLSECNEPGRGLLRVLIDRAVPPKPAQGLLDSPDAPATRFIEEFGIASDRGRWCIYLEGHAELGVLAV